MTKLEEIGAYLANEPCPCKRCADAEYLVTRCQELEKVLRGLAECPALYYTSYSGDIDRGENRKHVQCICCAANKGEPHLSECHVAEAERVLKPE